MILKGSSLRSIMFVPLFILAQQAAAPEVNITYIIASEPIRPFEKLLRAVFLTESAGDTLAFNDVEDAVGGFQIRPIRLLDYNQRTGKKYKIEDCYNFQVSKEIFLYYAEISGTVDYESIARNWNGSGTATITYWTKVKSFL